MTEEDFQRDLQTKYPEIWAVINKPGVYAVVRQAIEENWPENRLAVALQGTEYYRTTPDTSRQWDVVMATDPASARLRGDQMTQRVLQMAQSFGIKLTPENQWNIVVSALSGNWADKDISHALLFGAAFSGLDYGSDQGQVSGSAQQVQELAGQYAVPMSDETARRWALGMLDGAVTEDGLKNYMIEQAKSMYPGLGSALDRGVTVRQYADPYLQIAAQNLGVDPNSLDLTDQKWGQALNQIDTKTGERRAMSLAEWTKTIRTDQAFNYSGSQQGQEAGAQFANALGQRLGIVG